MPNDVDNCDFDDNEDQADCDGDTAGNACDADDDNDGVGDGADVCPNTHCPQCIVDVEGRPKGDLNDDCHVDLSDFSTFSVSFGARPCP